VSARRKTEKQVEVNYSWTTCYVFSSGRPDRGKNHKESMAQKTEADILSAAWDELSTEG